MMTCDLTCLDYVWRGLFVGTAAASIVLVVLLTLWFALKNKMSCVQNKWFLNYHILTLLCVLLSAFGFVATKDPELASGCFRQFVKQGINFSFTRFAAGSWLSIVVGLLFFDLCRIYSSLRRAKSFKIVKDEAFTQSLQSVLSRMNCHSKIELYSCEESVSPFVWGFTQYKIVVPDGFLKRIHLKTLENIFAHEIVHVRDHDAMWSLLELVCRRILFFHPLMIFVSAQYLLGIEKAADEDAIRIGQVSVQDLLKSLLEVVGLSRKLQMNPMILNASRSYQELKARIEALSQIEKPRHGAIRFAYTLGASVAMALGFSFAQAQISVGRFSQAPHNDIGMCTQVKQEQIIEAWLNIEPKPNRCEARER